MTAVAVVADISFDAAWKLLKTRRKAGPRWAGLTTQLDRTLVLKALGVKMRKMPIRQRKSLARWTRENALPDTLYLITTARHVQVLYNDLVLDQRSHCHMDHYPAKMSRMISAFRIDIPNG